jgi:hypothetical protein
MRIPEASLIVDYYSMVNSKCLDLSKPAGVISAQAMDENNGRAGTVGFIVQTYAVYVAVRHRLSPRGSMEVMRA